MRKLIVAVALVALFPLSASAQSVVGVWRLVEAGPEGNTAPVQSGMSIFTQTHFSFMADQASEPRPGLPQGVAAATLDQLRATLGVSGPIRTATAQPLSSPLPVSRATRMRSSELEKLWGRVLK